MTAYKDLTTQNWPDYELLDSGGNRKLERFGSVVISRPETQAIWKLARPEIWKNAHAVFARDGEKGSWIERKEVPESWPIAWRDACFSARLTSFKHTGIFPEQMPNWQWMADILNQQEHPQILNLFAYTGISSIVAAQNGARVTHVDASKQSLSWARENARLSGIADSFIRYIPDDALKFAKREVRRNAQYDGIILDPPAFGRGPKGEIWHIEEHLPILMDMLVPLLSERRGSFFLLNGYAAGYTPRSFLQLTESAFGRIESEYGELRIKETASERLISAGIYVRFVR